MGWIHQVLLHKEEGKKKNPHLCFVLTDRVWTCDNEVSGAGSHSWQCSGEGGGSGSVNSWQVSLCTQHPLVQLQQNSPPELCRTFSWHNLPAWGSAACTNKACGAPLLPLQSSSDLAGKLHLMRHVPKVPLTHLLGWHFSFSHSRSIHALSSCCHTFRQATCHMVIKISHFNDVWESKPWRFYFSSYGVFAGGELLLKRNHHYASHNTCLARTVSPVEKSFCSLPEFLV